MFCRLQSVRSQCFCYLNLLKEKLQVSFFLKTYKQIGYDIPLLLPFLLLSISMKLIFLLLTLELHRSHLVCKLSPLDMSALRYFSVLTSKRNNCTFLVSCFLKRHGHYLG